MFHLVIFQCWLSDENQLQLSVYILQSLDLFLSDLFFLLSISGHLCKLDLAWGLSAGYQPRPQVVDRGTTARYGGQLRYI